jgi:spermidine synthase
VIEALRPASARRLLAALFITTGATALLAEQAYEKLLETLVGTSTHAAATVLTIYFAGLTIGGFAYRWWRRLNARPLVLYAAFEAGIGLWALLLYAGFEHLISIFVPLLRLGANSLPLLQLLRVVVASAWILPPTILMGSTFPAVVDALRESFDDTRRTVTEFYALNILGGTVAAAAGPYLVFAVVGVDGALLVTALDLVVAAVAFWLSRRLSARETSEAVDEATAAPAAEGAVSGRGKLLIAVAFVCGLLFFALEVEWTHLIAAVCGNSVYSFASMLAAVLAGLFLGGMLAWRLWPAESEVPVALPASAFALGAILLALQQMAWPHVPHRFPVWGSGITSFGGAEGLRAFVTALVIVPPAAVIGAVFPLLFRLREFPAGERGRVAGAMTAANAVGCCAGALLSAFLLIPSFGSEVTLLLIALLYAITGAVLLLLVPAPRFRTAGLAGAALALLLCGVVPAWNRLSLTSGEHVYFTNTFTKPGTTLLFFHEDSAGGITTVVGAQDGVHRILLTNGKFQGSNGGEPVSQMAFAIIPQLHLQRLDRALVIGLGTGQSAAVTQAAGFRDVDIAEIAPGIVEASWQYFTDINHDVLRQPNVHLFFEDGRNLLLLRPTQYDLVTIEISSYWFAGATNLYSREFYELGARRLRPGGVLQQWVQLHHTSPREIAAVLLTARKAFRYVSLWVAGIQGVIVCSNTPQRIEPAGLLGTMRVLETSHAPPDVVCQYLRGRLLSPDDVDRLAAAAGGAVINTDRNRWIEYDTPRYNIGADRLQMNLRLIRSFARPAPLALHPAIQPRLQQLCPAAASPLPVDAPPAATN